MAAEEPPAPKRATMSPLDLRRFDGEVGRFNATSCRRRGSFDGLSRTRGSEAWPEKALAESGHFSRFR